MPLPEPFEVSTLACCLAKVKAVAVLRGAQSVKVIYRDHDLSCPSRFPRRSWEELPDRCHDASSGAGIHSSTHEFPHSSLSVKTHSLYSQTTKGHNACHRNGGVYTGMSEFCGGMEYATDI